MPVPSMQNLVTAALAQPDELEAAFQLIFQHVATEEREARVANALRLIEQKELDARGVFGIRGRNKLLGAMVCTPVPGASGLVWPPQTVTHTCRVQIEDQLLQSALSWLRQGGAKLAQALLSKEEKCLAPPLLRNGFSHITS